jgi:hypothetical protein
MKTLVSFALTIVLITGIPACTGFGPNPCGHVDPFFNIEGISRMETYEILGFERTVNPTESAMFEVHSFQAFFAVSYFATNATPKGGGLFMNTAYATSCADPGHEGSQEGIDSIFIITTVALDSVFMANDTINSIVKFSNDNSTFLPVQEFIKANKTAIRNPAIQWRITQKPTNLSVVHSFKMILKLTNGETYTAFTVPFFFI